MKLFFLLIILIVLNILIYKTKEYHSTLYTKNQYLLKNSYIGKHKLKSTENKKTLATYLLVIAFLITLFLL